jgi:hypothetical protein
MLAPNDDIVRSGNRLVDAGIDHWRRLACGRSMPRRDEFDPMQIPRLLPYAILLDIQRAPLDFQYRVAGQYIVENFGVSPVRRTASELAAENPSIGRFVDNFRTCVETRAPVVVEDSFIGADNHGKRTVGAILPLADRAGNVSHLLAFSVFLTYDGKPIGY